MAAPTNAKIAQRLRQLADQVEASTDGRALQCVMYCGEPALIGVHGATYSLGVTALLFGGDKAVERARSAIDREFFGKPPVFSDE